jgi:hypothetical protein
VKKTQVNTRSLKFDVGSIIEPEEDYVELQLRFRENLTYDTMEEYIDAWCVTVLDVLLHDHESKCKQDEARIMFMFELLTHAKDRTMGNDGREDSYNIYTHESPEDRDMRLDHTWGPEIREYLLNIPIRELNRELEVTQNPDWPHVSRKKGMFSANTFWVEKVNELYDGELSADLQVFNAASYSNSFVFDG